MSASAPDRAARLGQRPFVLWFTGLSGAGKSTIAERVDRELTLAGRHTYLLDGDSLRQGLCSDLGFTDEGRTENIRRVGEVARLFVDAGLIVLAAFISPFRSGRERARGLLAAGQFIEVFVDTPLELCVARDPKGLYARARAGGIKDFTGMDSRYEPPEYPELTLKTAERGADDLAKDVVDHLRRGGFL